MTVYIEMFVIQNILINFCLLRLVELTTKCRTTFFRLILSSILGSAFSVIVSIFITNNLLINILKFICAIIMLIACFKQTKKQFLFNFILLFLYTYALGGAIVGLSSSVYNTSFGVIISSKISIEWVTLLAIAITYIFELIVKHLSIKLKTKNFIYSLTLINNKHKVSINAYLDTGNLLSLDGNPVIIVDLNVYLKLSGQNVINFYLSKGKSINLNTIAGENNLKIYSIDKVIIKQGRMKKEISNQLIAVNSLNTFKDTNYQALLTPAII